MSTYEVKGRSLRLSYVIEIAGRKRPESTKSLSNLTSDKQKRYAVPLN